MTSLFSLTRSPYRTTFANQSLPNLVLVSTGIPTLDRLLKSLTALKWQLSADRPDARASLCQDFLVIGCIAGPLSCPSSCRRIILGFCILFSVAVIVTLRLSPSETFQDGPGRR